MESAGAVVEGMEGVVVVMEAVMERGGGVVRWGSMDVGGFGAGTASIAMIYLCRTSFLFGTGMCMLFAMIGAWIGFL